MLSHESYRSLYRDDFAFIPSTILSIFFFILTKLINLVLNAVDKPELSHLRNVIVFPRTGMRPIADQCSGGDLDGDKFFVCWDPKLMPNDSILDEVRSATKKE